MRDLLINNLKIIYFIISQAKLKKNLPMIFLLLHYRNKNMIEKKQI